MQAEEGVKVRHLEYPYLQLLFMALVIYLLLRQVLRIWERFLSLF